jgi:nitrate reductase NapAB chaperone NapD
VKVQVTVVFDAIGKLVVVVPVINPEQLSDAVGSAILVTAVHVEVIVGRDEFVGIGAMASPTSTTCVCVDVLPNPSVKVQITLALDVIGKLVVVVPTIDPEQLSKAVGAVKLVTGVHIEVIVGRDEFVGTGA